MTKLLTSLFICIYLISFNAFSQQHGGGTGEGPVIVEGPKCRASIGQIKKLIEKYNKYKTLKKDKIETLLEYLNVIKAITIKINFQELNNATEQMVRERCGDKYVNKILKDNPWLLDKDIHKLFKTINGMNKQYKCKDYDFKELDIYQDFLEIWIKKEKEKIPQSPVFIDHGAPLGA